MTQKNKIKSEKEETLSRKAKVETGDRVCEMSNSSSENLDKIRMKPDLKDSKFVKFQIADNRFDVFNHKGEYLGEISFYNKWKCHVWEQRAETAMSSECLETVLSTLKELDANVK